MHCTLPLVAALAIWLVLTRSERFENPQDFVPDADATIAYTQSTPALKAYYDAANKKGMAQLAAQEAASAAHPAAYAEKQAMMAAREKSRGSPAARKQTRRKQWKKK